jgi:2-dehydro-3-deoxyphosphogluconate aldolase/(4S)-4-hydroxy-2-oxoglutarate aldolase
VSADALLRALTDRPVLAILRGDYGWDEVQQAARALTHSGYKALEYTWNSPDAARTVTRLRQTFGDDLLVGAGTILNAEEADEAARAGAQFLVSPHFGEDVSAAAKRAGLPYLPGVLTPTEVAAASAAGWPLLKLFPGGTGGPAHLRALKGPFDKVRFMVTGGVSAANARAYLDAGAVAVAMGSAVFKPGATLQELTDGLAQMTAALSRPTEGG